MTFEEFCEKQPTGAKDRKNFEAMLKFATIFDISHNESYEEIMEKTLVSMQIIIEEMDHAQNREEAQRIFNQRYAKLKS